MKVEQISHILEAVLLSATQSVSIHQIYRLFDDEPDISQDHIQQALNMLTEHYQHRSVELKCIQDSYHFQTKASFAPWIQKLSGDKSPQFSRAFLETLAIIAYQQPVTRADIEEIRGVSVSSTIIKALLDHEWIKVAGHKDVPGKPALFKTTKAFLRYFNLESLEQLPALKNTE